MAQRRPGAAAGARAAGQSVPRRARASRRAGAQPDLDAGGAQPNRAGGAQPNRAGGAQPNRAGGAQPNRSGGAQPSSASELAGQRDPLPAVIEPVVAAAGLDLEGLAVSRAGRRYVVRVTVDRDGGIGHDALGEVSRDISDALDAAEAAGGLFSAGPYTLEVSSPGVDRPLTLARHWRRNVGRLVRVRAAGRVVLARITAADGDGVTLDLDGSRQSFAFSQLGPGRVQVEFARPVELPAEDPAGPASGELEGGP